MVFLAPVFLWLLALLPPAIALFLVRRRAERRLTSTLAFFLDLHRHYRESPWLRWLKRLLALLLALIVLLALIGSLSRPVQAPLDEQTDALIVVIDRSASTGARHDDERSVLAVGLEGLVSQLRSVPPGVAVVLIASDVSPSVVLPPGADRRQLERVCNDLRPRELPGHHDAALALARDLAAGYSQPALWLLADRPSGDEDVRFLPLPRPAAGNAGITACRLARRALDPSQVECFLELQANDERMVELEVRIDGELAALRSLDLRPDEPRALILPLEAGAGSELVLQLRSEAADALAADDRVRLPCPPAVGRRIRLVAPTADPFSELALACMAEGIELELLGPGDWGAVMPAADLTIFHGWVPEELPNEACFLIDPPRSSGPVGLKPLGQPMPVDDLRVHDAAHPLLVGVASARVGLLQTAVIDDRGLLAPLWSGPTGCVLAAGERDGRRLVVLAADPARSGRLPLELSWPTLLANVVHWSVPPEPLDDASRPTGSLLTGLRAPLVWEDGSTVDGTRVRLERSGLWRSGERQGGAALLDAGETQLPPPRQGEAEAGDETAVVGTVDWALALILLAIAVLGLDQWLAHRKGVF